MKDGETSQKPPNHTGSLRPPPSQINTGGTRREQSCVRRQRVGSWHTRRSLSRPTDRIRHCIQQPSIPYLVTAIHAEENRPHALSRRRLHNCINICIRRGAVDLEPRLLMILFGNFLDRVLALIVRERARTRPSCHSNRNTASARSSQG